MNDLLVLVKLLSALYQAKKLKDTNLITELVDTLNELPVPNSDVFTQDKGIRDSIRATIRWLLEQPEEDVLVIKSSLMQRVSMFVKNDESLKEAIQHGLEDQASDEMTRKVIYQHISEIRLNSEGEEFAKKFKKAIKDFYFKDINDMGKDDWANLIDLVQAGVNQGMEERQSEIVAQVTSEAPDSFNAIIDMAKRENSLEGIMKSGIQGLNIALNPDGGFRRGKMYMIEALTNRGKSLATSHMVASIGLYNKPMLRDKAKIPTILLESAEDTMDLIIMRMYKLALSARHGITSDFQTAENMDIVDAIVSCFKENGWYLIINQIDSSKDSANTMFARCRQLELKGHEIIFWAYDYCGLQNIDKIPGETKSDKLQMHFRKIRGFIIARGICFLTPHQLSPAAKMKLQESDEESEVYFAREVSGKSLTETSTKITNEVDVVITIHVAKTTFKVYFTFCVGKQRGEGCLPEERFGIYDLHPEKGLEHDIGKKAAFRRSLTQRLNENGDLENDFDHFGVAA
jgi:hypothetical protein